MFGVNSTLSVCCNPLPCSFGSMAEVFLLRGFSASYVSFRFILFKNFSYLLVHARMRISQFFCQVLMYCALTDTEVACRLSDGCCRLDDVCSKLLRTLF